MLISSKISDLSYSHGDDLYLMPHKSGCGAIKPTDSQNIKLVIYGNYVWNLALVHLGNSYSVETYRSEVKNMRILCFRTVFVSIKQQFQVTCLDSLTNQLFQTVQTKLNNSSLLTKTKMSH